MQIEKHLLTLLRKHAGSEQEFLEQLRKVDAAVASNKNFECLSGGKITLKMLNSVLAELRPLCEFPIRPCVGELSKEPALTPFGRALEMFGDKARHVDPNVVAFQLVYLKLGHQVVSLVKARGVCSSSNAPIYLPSFTFWWPFLNNIPWLLLNVSSKHGFLPLEGSSDQPTLLGWL